MKSVHSGMCVEEAVESPAYQAFQILHCVFVIVPIVAGLDKFFVKMVDWTMYLWLPLGNLVGGSDVFMRIAGGIEILAGCVVAFKPKIGALIVAAWLVGIIINLLLVGGYFDIALRDLGLCVAAIALSRLSVAYEHLPLPHSKML